MTNPDTIAVIVGEMRDRVRNGPQVWNEHTLAWADRLAALGWRPIETAPKDGSAVVDLWTTAGRIADAHYDADNCWWVSWNDFELGGTGYKRIEFEVTHWMPLPAAPTGGSDDARS